MKDFVDAYTKALSNQYVLLGQVWNHMGIGAASEGHVPSLDEFNLGMGSIFFLGRFHFGMVLSFATVLCRHSWIFTGFLFVYWQKYNFWAYDGSLFENVYVHWVIVEESWSLGLDKLVPCQGWIYRNGYLLQVHEELRVSSRNLTVDKLIETFISLKTTGTEKPGRVVVKNVHILEL